MGLDLFHFLPVHPDNTSYSDIVEKDWLNAHPECAAALLGWLEAYEGNYRLHYRVLGHQRKGMNASFCKDFQDGYHFKLEVVESAYAYLKADHISPLDRLQENFRSHFINNFIPGQSIFCVSF
ncbi:hypothetical protein [Flavihumibacter petaseus]|nr:hypothetical protein [Flavihumibacter petaseus]